MDDEWPRPMVMRGRKRKGVQYFGPYGHAYAIRETLDLLLRTFPLRTCSDNKFNQHQRLGRPCLLFHIEKCSGPVRGGGRRRRPTTSTSRRCSSSSTATPTPWCRSSRPACTRRPAELEFEQAARLRDRLTSVQKAIEKQQMVAERSEDFDVLGIADDELEAAVQVFFVRKGRVVGRKGFIVDKVEDLTPGRAGQQRGRAPLRRPAAGDPEDGVRAGRRRRPAALRGVARRRSAARRSSVRVPLRGQKRELQETVTRNAREEFVRHRLRRASDHNSRAKALNELQEHLGLPDAPLRIECYDMSHIQGSDYVGSMVVVEDGLPKKSDYRRFKIKGDQGNDDFAAMEQVLTRRLTAYLAERRQPDRRPTGKFTYPPQLLLVDGGKGQLSVAVRVLEELGLADEIPVAALAKRFEEIYVPGEADPIRLPRQSEALYLLQRIRDEAHRFAITFHRELRGKRMTTSVLDGITGLGEVRRKRLVKELGGVKAVKAASLEDLQALPWLPDAVAARGARQDPRRARR